MIMPRPTTLGTALLATALLLPAACRFQQLGEEIAALHATPTLAIDVVTDGDAARPCFVFALHADTLERVGIGVVHGPGRAELRCPPGEYVIGAFQDLDEDFSYDDDEPARLWNSAIPLRVEPSQSVAIALELEPMPDDMSPRVVETIRRARAAHADLKVRGIGKRATLDDPRFSRDNVDRGLWKPRDFLFDDLLGIYLLEEYDPSRTPVVFVHGFAGSPTDFRATIAALDRDRYQAWVYFYPTSLRLEELGKHLFRSLVLLHSEHKPDSIAVVAHSMGGLVSRSALAAYTRDGHHDFIERFVTIASPLGGMPSAAIGAYWAPTPMPCWYDLVPSSPFLSELFTTPLRVGLRHDVVFAFEAGSSSDGAVELTSQLRPEALDQVNALHAVEADHVGVLAHPRCHEALARILASLHE